LGPLDACLEGHHDLRELPVADSQPPVDPVLADQVSQEPQAVQVSQPLQAVQALHQVLPDQVLHQVRADRVARRVMPQHFHLAPQGVLRLALPLGLELV
jgi:hypothetical protein